MSEFHIQVVRLGAVEPHPDADTLSITLVHGGYPCIIRTGELHEGELAVYVPVDALVPVDRPATAFLAPRAKKGFARIRALRLRGIFSMGLLLPAEPGWEEGQDVRALLGIEKYEPPEPSAAEEAAPELSILPVYDLDGLRRWPNLLQEGEEVVLTEKVHGANGRACWHEGALRVGSRNQMKLTEGDTIWARLARAWGLEEKLRDSPYALYFEVYGPVQDLRYGKGELRGAVFDVLELRSRRWLDVDEADAFVASLGLPRVPVLHRGPWSAALCALAEGPTVIGEGAHVREGFVVRPVRERVDRRAGRVVLKLHGEGYLLRKSG
jgi:RNA ligase (TIGR02306 family)